MASTYTPIATATGTGSSNTITFSSIAGTYTDLEVVCAINGVANGEIYFRFNGDTGSNYSRTYLYGNGSSAVSGRDAALSLGYVSSTTPVTVKSSIMNYANSTTYKTALSRNADASAITIAIAGLWRSTSAINSVSIVAGTGNFSSTSTFTLYGIQAA